MERIVHDGRRTAYRLAGGEPAGVLYVHGSGATHRVWGAQYGPDGPARPSAALDLSGHGESGDIDAEPGPEALAAYARDVIAVAEETEATVLAGNSLGGAVVMHVALETSFDLDGLILAGTGAKLAVFADLRERFDDDFDRAIEFLHGEDMLFHDADEGTLEHSRTEMAETGRGVTRRDFLTCHQFDVRGRLDEIDCPALAVVGEYDGLTPPSYHEYLAEQIPDCEYREIPDAAHLAMAERPDEFNDAVASFLDQRSLAGST